MTILAHKIRLYPNNKQKTFFSKSCGCRRFAYNWALNEWNEQYKNGHKPNEGELRKQLNTIKKKAFPWMYEVSKCCVQNAIMDLGIAFDRFFDGLAEHPKFKKKFVHDSFTLDNENFKVCGTKIYLAKIGWIRMVEQFKYAGAKLLFVTVSVEAGQWYASITCEIPTRDKQLLLPFEDFVFGIDRGVRSYADSNGKHTDVPRSYRKAEKKLRRSQQSLSRKYEAAKRDKRELKESKNYQKQRVKVARIHKRVHDIREDWLHKFTTDIVRNNQTIVIEDLNVQGMVKNRCLAKSILDAGFGEFKRQLSYKSQWCGRTLIQASRWYASSKICSVCGVKTKQRLPLHVREWKCEHCGATHDRDVNAAVNLKQGGIKCLVLLNAGSSSVSACGEFLPLVLYGNPCDTKAPRKSRKRKKQEINSISAHV
jgi:putative transposase